MEVDQSLPLDHELMCLFHTKRDNDTNFAKPSDKAGTKFGVTAAEAWNQQRALKLNSSSERLTWCHTDLAPRNILRLYDDRLALLDWTNAEFYPRLFEIEAIFEKIIKRLVLDHKDDEDRIELLQMVEYILLHYSTAIIFST
ncbi:hypothetical protein F5884DRAFT_832093 [Xylogone sp. PMI_703]|nr:hypothetical protein F5884DRAFT_832093 [Xylogone sp. PMI_703]